MKKQEIIINILRFLLIVILCGCLIYANKESAADGVTVEDHTFTVIDMPTESYPQQ